MPNRAVQMTLAMAPINRMIHRHAAKGGELDNGYIKARVAVGPRMMPCGDFFEGECVQPCLVLS